MENRNDGTTSSQEVDVEEVSEPGSDSTYSEFFGTAKEVLARYTHCPLCGANLHFTHVTDFNRNITQELARCPECGTKVRKLVHRLQ